MNVASYIYQSPSPSATQVGRLDPSSVKEESSASSQSFDVTTKVEKEAQSFAATQKSEAKSTVSSQHLLDIYV